MYIGAELNRRTGKDVSVVLTTGILLINTWIFLFSSYPVSWRIIKDHDEGCAAIISELRLFEPSTTVFLILPYIFNGFRQVMYYLPEYRVYQVDVTISPSGRKRDIFWGIGRDTFLSKRVELPMHIRYIATLLADDNQKLVGGKEGITLRPILPGIAVAFGPVDHMRQMYPDLTISSLED
jgi:hypothetical protein